MNLPVFIDTRACRGGKHCFLCRDPGPRGQAWRAAMQRTHRVPAKWICPIERGSKPMAPSPQPGLGTLIEKTIKVASFGLVKPCVTCAQHRAGIDRRFHF